MLIRYLLKLSLILAIPSQGFSFQEALGVFVSQVESEIQERSYDDEVLQKLYAYRQQVEKGAYRATLKLCEGYRRAKSLGPHPYHGKYMYTESEALGAWAQIAYEGSIQPLSALGGLKADFLDKAGLGLGDYRTWFGSMYTMYLVNSTGFLMGALHCLDMNHDEFLSGSKVGQLASAIVGVDYYSSAAGYIATFWSSGKVLALISKKAGGFFFSNKRVLSNLSSRLSWRRK